MAAIITSGTITTSSAVARAEEIRTAFIENKQALTWLAEFLIGDEIIAPTHHLEPVLAKACRRRLIGF